MSTRLVGARPAGARLGPLLGGWALLILFLHSACATHAPLGGRVLSSGPGVRSLAPPVELEERATAESGFAGAVVHEVDVFEPGTVATRPVPVNKGEFQRAVQQLARDMHLEGTTPQEAARELLKAHPELEGDWLAEVSRGRVLTLVPEKEGPLAPEADTTLRRKYEGWCQQRGWGRDCLHLYEDGPYLRADDRRTLALALCFGSVLEETSQALARELNPRALVATLVWAVAMYAMMWLLPEPTTKALAGALTVILVGWLGLDTVWELMDGWARLANRAHEATTFAELREAGEEYARVLGTDAARALILGVSTLTGRTLGEVAARVRTLPGYNLAASQWVAQRGGAAVLGHVEVMESAVAQEGALARAVATVETVVATHPRAPWPW